MKTPLGPWESKRTSAPSAGAFAERSSRPSCIDAQLDTIFAEIRHFSKIDVRHRIHQIDVLLEAQADPDIVKASWRMEQLIDRLGCFSKSPRGEAYREARQHMLCAFRYVMRGEYRQAREYLQQAAESCCGMA